MKTGTMTQKILGVAILVILPLIAAAWFVPPDFPMLLRQLLLTVWGVGATLVAERLLFSPTLGQSLRALGFVRPRWRVMVVALLVSLPMWLFLPLLSWSRAVPISLQPNWLALLIGVVLVNGITEEVIHRAFVFGHLRSERSFLRAATLSAALFAAQHLYLGFSIGWAAGLASVVLAALLSFPLAYLYEQGGNSTGAPALIHTSTNAPMIILAMPPEVAATVLAPYMGVILVSLYLVFACHKYLTGQGQLLSKSAPPRPASTS